jgi:hypothetical protein
MAVKFTERVVAQRKQHGSQVHFVWTLQYACSAETLLCRSVGQCALVTDAICHAYLFRPALSIVGAA